MAQEWTRGCRWTGRSRQERVGGEEEEGRKRRAGHWFVGLSCSRKVLSLDLLDNVLGDALELAQRRLREPHAPVDHLAKVEDALGETRPPALQHDLVDATHQPRGALRDVRHVGEEREAVELELRDVGLQQHVRLCRRLVNSLLHRDGHALDQAHQLLLLLLAHRKR
eukprot:4863887-Pleurochrysis_carterae.AAC.2